MVAVTPRSSRPVRDLRWRAVLPDGSYDVFVVDAAADGPGVLRLDVTILAGDQKGEVVTLRADGLGRDELDALGLPGTLRVEGGEPSLTLED